MPAYSMEKMLLEGRREVKELFEFVMDNADAMNAYEIEKGIFFK